MFELAAGQVQQDERERTIAAALRRRQLLENQGAPDRTATASAAASKAPRRDSVRVAARADR
jgi:hypothetical protein